MARFREVVEEAVYGCSFVGQCGERPERRDGNGDSSSARALRFRCGSRSVASPATSRRAGASYARRAASCGHRLDGRALGAS